MKKLEFEHNDICVIADIHGRFDKLIYNVEDNENIRDCILFIAGDVGLGFYDISHYNVILNNLNELFIKRNIICLMIRGNHDDPSYYSENKINYSNIKTISDYTVVTVGYKSILCVGGAISIDRSLRKMEDYMSNSKIHSYWEDEVPVYDETKLDEILKSNINIEYVITHTSPHFCFKNKKDGLEMFIKQDKELDNDLDIERQTMTRIYNKLFENFKITEWIYGHFHKYNVEYINDTKFVALKNSDNKLDIYTIY